VFVDVVGKINDEEAMLRRTLLSWFLDCPCDVSALLLILGPWKRVRIDEIPSHRGFGGFVCVQFAGARWMYLPMRQWADATPLQQRPRYRAALHGNMRPGCAFNRPNQSADDPATGHDILPTGPDLRPVWELPMATSL
jgi:hypothetical protein